ncbi:MAG: hypothetical protein JXA20_09485 [Spirochaetes bacterium]|nr:hypothetical protein [Spirochaetota bacterium]
MRKVVMAAMSAAVVLVSISVSYSTSMMGRARQLLEMKLVITNQAENEWQSNRREMEMKLKDYLKKYDHMINQYNASSGNNPQFVIREVPHKRQVMRLLHDLRER